MLRSAEQMEFPISNHQALYDMLVESDNFWRKLNESIDFSFVYEAVKDNYSSTMGRTAKDVVRMFKYLLLKAYYKLSDAGLVRRAKTDLLFKYFLGYRPEETELIDPSLLTVFRRERLKTNPQGEEPAADLLDQLIQQTVKIAIEKGVLKTKNNLIVDSTHSNALYHHVSPREALLRQAKALRKSIYRIDESMKANMPAKSESRVLEDQIEYVKKLLRIVDEERFTSVPEVKEKMDLLSEIAEDTEVELEYSKDQDAKIGHKRADTAFFGYKTHLAMTPERIITAATITSGEANDGKRLKELLEKSQEAGIKVEAVIGDGAYSEQDNLEYCEKNNIKNVSKVSAMVTHGKQKNRENFSYNKDAGRYVCKAGHMAIYKVHQKGSKNNSFSEVERYYFDVENCKHCPFKEGCYKEGAKTKSLNITIKKEIHSQQMEYMETDEFKTLYAERYKIEAKNAELKNNYGYGQANACGKTGITIQGAATLFLANLKRIYKLEMKKGEEVAGK